MINELKFKLLFGLLIFRATISYAQNIDTASFNQKTELVKWFCAYDEVSETVDRYVGRKVGTQEYIEFKKHKRFYYIDSTDKCHFILGDIENNRFKLFKHYLALESYVVKETDEAIDTVLAKSMILALTEADKLTSKHIGVDSIKFNQYATKNRGNNSIDVFFLPASVRENDHKYYTCHFHYLFDSTGNLLREEFFYKKSHDIYCQMKRSDAFKLAYIELEQPTLGVIYSIWEKRAWYYDFEVYTKNNVTVLRKHKNSPHYFWEHMNIKDYEKEQRKKLKRRKRRKRQRERFEKRIE